MDELTEVKSTPELIKTISVDGVPVIEFYEVQSGLTSIPGNFSAIEGRIFYSYGARKIGHISNNEVLKHWDVLKNEIAQKTTFFNSWLTILP